MRGPGVCAPLEGNVVSSHVVVNGYTALEHLKAGFFYDYTPQWEDTRRIPMYRAPALTSEAWAAYQTNPAPVTLLLNEPNNANRDGDAASAATVAGLLAGVTLDWCGPNVMYGLGSSRQWITDYIAAGGVQPSVNGFHAYPASGAELRAWVSDWRAFLTGFGWRNPLVLTEVGPRPGSGDAADVLRGMFDLLREGLIQAAFWFSHRYPADGGMWSAGDLLRSDGSLLPLGAEFRRLATGQPGPVRPKLDKSIYLPVARR